MGIYRHEPLVVVLDGAVSVATNLALALIWWYANRMGRIVSPETDSSLVRRTRVRIFLAAGLSLVAIGVSFVNVRVAHVFFLATPRVSLSHGTVKTRGESRP
jgi:hypothetical protein